MSVIIPRWEWRMFGPTPRTAEAAFAALDVDRVQESDEMYLLSPDPTADTVKVRDELMDIKALREVDGEGLERWEPIRKARFPLSADDARATIEALRVGPVVDRGRRPAARRVPGARHPARHPPVSPSTSAGSGTSSGVVRPS